MNLLFGVPLALHQLAGVIWVGGMFFAHFALRPTLKLTLEPPARIQVALGVFRRFFPWVWLCVVVLWVTGGWVSIFMLNGKLGAHVHVMMGTAAIMTLVFVYLYLTPFGRMRLAVERESWREASAEFARIRHLMGVNLVLGILTVIVAALGPLGVPALLAMISPPS
ncbi:MAG: CopD family protein [Bdellovibrio bacteriovorus]